MADEIQYRHSATGATLYATIRSAAGQYWNGSAFEDMQVANWGDYDIPLSESPAGGYRYVGTFPGDIGEGQYELDVYLQAGGSAAIDDVLLASAAFAWDGSAEASIYTADKAAAAAQAAAESADEKLPADTTTKLGRLDAAISTRSSHTAADAGTDAAGKVLTTPANTLATDASGRVTVGSNADKTDYKLASDGLDGVSTAEPSGVASNFREIIVQLWRRFFGKAVLTQSGDGSGTLKTYAEDGTTEVTSQALSDNGTTQTQGEAG